MATLASVTAGPIEELIRKKYDSRFNFIFIHVKKLLTIYLSSFFHGYKFKLIGEMNSSAGIT